MPHPHIPLRFLTLFMLCTKINVPAGVGAPQLDTQHLSSNVHLKRLPEVLELGHENQ